MGGLLLASFGRMAKVQFFRTMCLCCVVACGRVLVLFVLDRKNVNGKVS